jgi:hypothetical protein
VRRSSRELLRRKVLGYSLLVAGGLIVLFTLPLWVWLAVMGAGVVTAGWYILGYHK